MGLWIIGAGGFGREVLDALLAAGTTADGFIDDFMGDGTTRGLPRKPVDHLTPEDRYVIGIADPVVRARLAGELEDLGLRPAKAIHPRAIVGPETRVGRGSVILGNAHVSSSVTLGRHTHINYNATVGHDAVLEDIVTVLPGANVGGTTHLARHVTIGSNATVLQGLRIGAGATVGAGAVVTRDVDPGTTVVGCPARPID